MLVVDLQMQEAGHVAHFRVANPTLLQVRSLESSPNYMILEEGLKITLRTTKCTQGVILKSGCVFERM